MDIQPSEISKILKEEIKNFGTDSEITEVGRSFQLVMELPEFTDWIMFKLEKWCFLTLEQKVWHLI